MARVIVKVLVTTVTVLTLGPISSVADELSGEALYGLACAACHNPGVQVDHRVGPPLGKLNQRKAGSVRAMSTRLLSQRRRFTGTRLS